MQNRKDRFLIKGTNLIIDVVLDLISPSRQASKKAWIRVKIN